MTQAPPASIPARELFPELPRIPSLYRAEVEGVSEERLDRRRPEKSWGLWSIREQVSHMTLLPYRWLLVRWGPTLFGDRLPRDPELLRTGFSVRTMNPARFHVMDDLLAAQADAFALAWEVLGRETLSSLRAREISERIPWGTRHPPAYEEEREWRERVLLRAHSTGVRVDPADPDLFHYDLEFTFRHILWEAYVHLRTIQMHKQAEGLPLRAEIPQVGYLLFHRWE